MLTIWLQKYNLCGIWRRYLEGVGTRNQKRGNGIQVEGVCSLICLGAGFGVRDERYAIRSRRLPIQAGTIWKSFFLICPFGFPSDGRAGIQKNKRSRLHLFPGTTSSFQVLEHFHRYRGYTVIAGKILFQISIMNHPF